MSGGCSVCGLVWGGECPTFACSEVKRLRSELDDARASEAELRGMLAASREQVQAMRCERDEWRNEWQGAYENASRWKRERERIVAWLRECYSIHRKENIPLPDWYDAADGIEAGEHVSPREHSPDVSPRERRECEACSGTGKVPHKYSVDGYPCTDCEGMGVQNLHTEDVPVEDSYPQQEGNA